MNVPFVRNFWLLGLAAFLLAGRGAVAAPLGVRDDAHFFSQSAVSQADQVIHQIDDRHHHDLLIETFPNVPQELRPQLESQGKGPFFRQWTDQRALQQGVRGVYVLICKDPAHLQAAVGNATAKGLFTDADRDELSRQMLAAFKEKNYDQGLISGVQLVQQRMDSNAPAAGSAGAAPSGAPIPSDNSTPSGPFHSSPFPGNGSSWGIGGIACLIIGAIVFIILIRGVLGRSGGGTGQPGGYYPPGPGYPPQGGGYQQGGGGFGYGGGGGGGMGRGFLGGLLGGALGGYAADRWLGRGEQQPGGGFVPPAPGAAPDSADTGFSSTGGDFGSADSGGGADLGGGGGGGDFGGGGGGDSGGGGGGGDF